MAVKSKALSPRRKRMSRAARLQSGRHWLTARGESLAAFDGRCIPAGCVAPRSNTPGILGRRALPAGRLARLGATPDFHHGLLRARSQGWKPPLVFQRSKSNHESTKARRKHYFFVSSCLRGFIFHAEVANDS